MPDQPALDPADLLSRLADVIYAVDVEGRFTYLNPAGSALFGWEPDELLGEHFSKVVDPTSIDETSEHFRRGLGDPASRPYFEIKIRRPDGEVREMEVHAGSVFHDGEVVGRQGVGRDITELRRLQSELADKTSRLALVEAQQQAAMDLYRRLSMLTGNLLQHPDEAQRALDVVERTMQGELAQDFGLDEQDLPIIRLVADGWSNQEIAEKVHLSVHTVKDRVARIVTRLDARSRAGVGARAAEAGLLLATIPADTD